MRQHARGGRDLEDDRHHGRLWARRRTQESRNRRSPSCSRDDPGATKARGAASDNLASWDVDISIRLAGDRTDSRACSRSGLLGQDGLAHHGILAGHPATQRTLDLGPERQLVQVVRLLWRRHKALLLQRLIFQALDSVTVVGDIDDPGVSAGQTSDGALGIGERGATTHGGKALRGAILERSRSV